ncbi:RNA-directed DNA methylation 4 [Lactuca sativa]|uniref:Transcription factor Iwr1 domain-containing protein n=1 Tax=Lactuca sativa TaxID=4236 RepID=A0A9R1UKH8_LACSA|nr:RNA-directed DNA methylation 4 [Lactuca sativa]KAJ0188546.1 hypothetical protein LSAT_V11C900462270 [Lactuca sativa]
MVDEAGSSSTASLKDDKPVIVRVKRKSYQSPLEAFWLEVNERPVKRPLLDFEKLSINNATSQVEEVKPKKFFVQHVDTVSSSDVTVDVLQSFVTSKPTSADALVSKAKVEDQRRSNKTENKQKQLLVKAKETQEILAKNARFEQIWKSRKGKDTAASDDALRDMCHLYDVVRVDAGETSGVHEEEDEEDERLLHSFLPLLREFIPSAAEDIESEIDYQMIKKASRDEYVYDLYAVKDGNMSMMDENTSSPFPFVQVNEDDDFYDGPDNSDYETDDSNAEDNPMNDYPDEEEEEASESGDENSEDEDEEEEEEKESSKSGSIVGEGLSEDENEMLTNFDEDEDKDDDEMYW